MSKLKEYINKKAQEMQERAEKRPGMFGITPEQAKIFGGAYEVGANAIMALDLPVKFHLWTRTPEFMDWLHLQSVQDDEQVTKLAYQYWIENIYKPE